MIESKRVRVRVRIRVGRGFGVWNDIIQASISSFVAQSRFLNFDRQGLVVVHM